MPGCLMRTTAQTLPVSACPYREVLCAWCTLLDAYDSTAVVSGKQISKDFDAWCYMLEAHG